MMILVTGGTGLVGSHLLYTLLQEEIQVRAIHRKTSDLSLVEKVFSYYTDNPKNLFEKIEWVEADIIDVPALTEAFEEITHVYHAAAYISFDPSHFYKLKKANIEGTANIVNLCIANTITKLVYVSSVATLGSKLNGALISEETEWSPTDKNSAYAITKFGAEMEVWRGSQEGLNVAIVNPGVIFGPFPVISGSSVIIKMVDKKMPFYTSGSIGIVDVKDVVTILVKVMKSNISDQRFILVSKNITYKDLLFKIAESLKIKAPNKPISKWKLLLFSNLDWFSHKILNTKRKLMNTTVHSMYTDSNYNSGKVKKYLDFEFVNYEETIKSSVKSYIAQNQ